MERYPILSQINKPADLRALPEDSLEPLCEEIRNFLIQNVSRTGGHLASNLGTVELTVAIHRVFDSPADSIVWDVGHQSYTHKILTGRRDKFDTLRQTDGLSGFPKPHESEHDAFIAGHSSTSISAAYAISQANRLKGDPHHAVAVIGDGAFTGGMVYEAMNNAGRTKANLVVVLNHNSMSIGHNVGAFARYLSAIRAKPGYLRLKQRLERVLDRVPLVGQKLKEGLQSSKSALKYFLYHATFFEEMGFAYYGPVDGHDLHALEMTLRQARSLNRPAFIQVETVKGRGYEFAEKDPPAYHGVSSFDVETGNPDVSGPASYSQVFGRKLKDLAEADERICAITAAMASGTGLTDFAERFPERFFDVGIAEQHAVTFGAALASKGLLPVFAVYSTFLQRAYDQLLHDAAITGEHLILAIDRAGIVGDDGETHQGIYDIAFLTGIPGVSIYAPSANDELEAQLEKAVYHEQGITAVRYPRGSDSGAFACGDPTADHIFYPGSEKLTAVSYGRIFPQLYKAVSSLEEQPAVLKLNKVWPFSEQMLSQLEKSSSILFFEEAEQTDSISEHLLSTLYRRGWRGELKAVTLPDGFIPQGKTEDILRKYHLDADSMEMCIREEMNRT